MGSKPAITVGRPREEVERLWRSSEHRRSYADEAVAAVSFVDAPGGRGTEIRVDLEKAARAGRFGKIAQKLTGSGQRAKAMDDLRRFKQHVETGVIARSDAAPEGERAERKFKQRPAQPVKETEMEKAGV